MKLLYIPHGNIPSRWAHSFQAMKMAEALSAQVSELTLLTRGSLLPSPIDRVDLGQWYGLQRPVRVVRLPVHLRIAADSFVDVGRRRFDVAATAYARATRPDLVYCRSVQAGCWCVERGLRTVIETHGVPAASDFDRRALLKVAAIASRPGFVGLVTVTDYLAERYVELGVPADRIRVWPDAVDLQAAAAAPTTEAARKKLGLPPDAAIALYAGHLYPEKGVPILVEAARLLPEVTFLVVGGWPSDVERLERDAPGNVRWVGFVPHPTVREYLSGADLLLLPNSAKSEHAAATSPLKLFEYMAARRPVVATAIPALRPILRHGENAQVVTADDPSALAEGIGALLADRPHAAALAAQAFEDVQAFTWDRRAQELLDWARR